MKTFEAGEQTQTRFFIFFTEKGLPLPIIEREVSFKPAPSIKNYAVFKEQVDAMFFYKEVIAYLWNTSIEFQDHEDYFLIESADEVSVEDLTDGVLYGFLYYENKFHVLETTNFLEQYQKVFE